MQSESLDDQYKKLQIELIQLQIENARLLNETRKTRLELLKEMKR